MSIGKISALYFDRTLLQIIKYLVISNRLDQICAIIDVNSSYLYQKSVLYLLYVTGTHTIMPSMSMNYYH